MRIDRYTWIQRNFGNENSRGSKHQRVALRALQQRLILAGNKPWNRTAMQEGEKPSPYAVCAHGNLEPELEMSKSTFSADGRISGTRR